MAVDDQLLRRCYLFTDLPPKDLETVKRGMGVVKLEDGESLFHFGEKADRFFFLVQGRIKLFRVSAEGMEKVFDIILPGRMFAEAVMFMSQKAYPVNTTAIGPTKALSFDSSVFMGILEANPKLAFKLMAAMSRKLHGLINEIDQLTLQNATFRLASYLLNQIPAGEEGAAEVSLLAPKRVIASRLSIQPETFSRLLGRLTKQGLIRVSDQRVAIPDVEALRELVAFDESM